MQRGRTSRTRRRRHPALKVDRLTVSGTAARYRRVHAIGGTKLRVRLQVKTSSVLLLLQSDFSLLTFVSDFIMTTTLESSPQISTDLKSLASDVVGRAMSGGATAAECVVREGDEFSTVVRLGQVETLKEAGSRSIGVRVFFGQRAASTYSSDFSNSGIDRMLKSALELAKITSEDPFAGIPGRQIGFASWQPRSLSRRCVLISRRSAH